jgi:hypothetical protein
MDLKEIGWEFVELINLAQDMEKLVSVKCVTLFSN